MRRVPAIVVPSNPVGRYLGMRLQAEIEHDSRARRRRGESMSAWELRHCRNRQRICGAWAMLWRHMQRHYGLSSLPWDDMPREFQRLLSG